MEKADKAFSSLAGLKGDFTFPRPSDMPNLDSTSLTTAREIETLTVQMGLLSLVDIPVPQLIISSTLNRDVNSKNKSHDLIPDSKFKCPRCGKGFNTANALFGHMRIHPDKGYKSSKRPSIPKRKPKPRPIPCTSTYPPFTVCWSVTKKRGRKTVVDSPFSVTWSVTKKRGRKPVIARYNREAVEAASILMDLSKSTWTQEPQKETSSWTPLLELVNVACNLSSPTNQTQERRPCSYKVVIRGPTKQESSEMLEGASRKKAKGGPHECEICGQRYATGPQLGGHKRKHYKKEPQD